MVGRGWAHWWVAAGLAHYLLIIPAIAATELTTEPVPAPVQVSRILTLSSHLTRSLQNLLLTSLGGVLYIISGSATLTFYIPLVSTDQYPRHTGLALGGLTIMAGGALIRRSLHLIVIIYFPYITVHDLVGLWAWCRDKVEDTVTISTGLPLHSLGGGKERSAVRGDIHIDNPACLHYMGQTVTHSFQPDK